MSTNVASAYRQAEVETVSQRDLIVKLYQGAERFMVQAQLAMTNRQVESAHQNCQRAKMIFSELLSTLNFDRGGDVARQLRNLYVFFITHIAEANMRKDPSRLSEILPLIASLREAWQQIPEEHAETSSLPTGNDGHSFNFVT